ncbi:hypothetical protein DMH04_14855 [Kibdelosporangium aridum]|uniref:Carrier domain-containing protein n=1 Tax=Kibdelosporangium aridum TaxID=2030 RepID=A0A428ZD05_KIBAR|nr:condensation domain-containing protein [Kibdelosporangium aridum]RSM85957.1 hypothetical protein DMH04_14855 [Kibdelosporangium aridum]
MRYAEQAIERKVTEAVAEVLGSHVEPGQPLTECGASSLQLSRICAEIAAELDAPVPFSQFIRHPTVEGLSQWLARPSPESPAAPDEEDVPLAPFPAMCLVRQMLKPEDREDYCITTWLVQGPLDRSALTAALGDVQARHQALRAVYTYANVPVARPLPADRAPAPELIWEERPDVDQAVDAVRAQLIQPLNLEEGVVWRGAVCSYGAGLAVFGLGVHHVAFDGWSEWLLARDLSAAYAARLGGGTPDLGDTPSLRECAVLRARHDAVVDIDGQRAQALASLRGVPELPPLAGSDATGDDSEVVTFSAELCDPNELDVLTDQLAEAGDGTVRTGFVVLLAAYATAFREVTEGNDFALGVPVRQRFDARLDEVIGNHVAMVPVRPPATPGRDPEAAVEGAARAVTDAFAHQDVPLDELFRLLRPRQGTGKPVYQHIFALQDNPPALLDLPGAETILRRHGYLVGGATDTMAEVWPPGTGYDAERYTAALTYKKETVGAIHAKALLEAFISVIREWTAVAETRRAAESMKLPTGGEAWT